MQPRNFAPARIHALREWLISLELKTVFDGCRNLSGGGHATFEPFPGRRWKKYPRHSPLNTITRIDPAFRRSSEDWRDIEVWIRIRTLVRAGNRRRTK